MAANPEARTQPYSADELRQMRRDGDAISLIMTRAKRLNGWGKAKVREVLFGEG